MAPSRVRNLGVLAGLLLVIGVMTGLVSYSVTLYRLFCQATGFGGTTQRVAADDARLSDRIVTVRFSTDVAPDLPWRFEPVRREVKVHLGEDTLVFFRAENLSDKPLVGHATYNVTPAKAGRYFDKIQCFCFDEEKLGAGEKVEMPVDFFVSPDLAKDDETGDVDTITLAYTFFPSRARRGKAPRPLRAARNRARPAALRDALRRLPRPRPQQGWAAPRRRRRAPRGRRRRLSLFGGAARGGHRLVGREPRQMARRSPRLPPRRAHADQGDRRCGPARHHRLSEEPRAEDGRDGAGTARAARVITPLRG